MWETFKDHFQDAQQMLKDIRGSTMKQAGYHHANHLAAEIRQELRESQMQMLALATNVGEVEEIDQDEVNLQQFINNNANAVVQSNIQKQTAELLQSLQKDLQHFKDQLKTNGANPKKRSNKKTDNPTFARLGTSKYYWTHGACNHNSNECNRKAPGHKTNATKASNLGGSLAFCE